MYQAQRRRKKGKLWIALLFLCAVAVGLGVGYAGAKLNSMPKRIEAAPATPVPSSAPAQNATETPEPDAAVSYTTTVPEDVPQMPAKEGYLVKTTDGRVCVFRIEADGTPRYSQTMPVSLGDLPESDRQKLDSGIYLETKTELAELMEDYGS